jgi:hypothetical protein
LLLWKKNIFQERPLKTRISPLRCASVEMTKGKASAFIDSSCGKGLLFGNYSFLKRLLSPLSSRPEETWAFGPHKLMKSGFYSATTFPGSTALPFVISTEAKRSGEICVFSGLS